MKKTQKIISTVLVIMLLFSCISALPASAEEAPAPACALYFHNTLCWENVYQYAWDESGNPLTGDWPGKNLNPCGKDDYGYDIYSIDIPSGATGIVLNNNDSDQSDDITDFSVSGWYLDAERTSINIFGTKVYEAIPITEPVTDPEPEPTPEPAKLSRFMIGDMDNDDKIDINDVTSIQRYLAQMPIPDTYNPDAADADQNKEVKINDATLIQYFIAKSNREGNFCGRPVKNGKLLKVIEYTIYDSLGWGDITLIARDKGDRVLPGVSVSYSGESFFGWKTFTATIPQDAFSLTAVSEDGSKKTLTMTNLDPTWSTEYAIMVDPYSENPRNILNDVTTHWAPPPEDPVFLFENSMNWDEVYAFAWDEYGADLLGEWPGKKLTDIKSTDNGIDTYSVKVPIDAKGVILNDGNNGIQTATITDFYPEGGGYYLDPDKTDTDDYGQTTPALVPFKDTPKSEFNFINSLNWSDVYVIMYDEKGIIGKIWPGTKQTYDSLNEFGEEIYRIKVPKNVTGMVICDGKDGQTSLITDFDQYAYYLIDSDFTVNDLGEIEYTPLTF